jgi:hypothetical protein
VIKWLTILLLTSCTTSSIVTERKASKTVTLDGSQSHAAEGQQLIHVQWRDINGTAVIENPESLVTKATVTKGTTFELWGQQTDGLSAKDSMNVIIK